MPRNQPPTPKERPVTLAATGPSRPASAFPGSPETKGVHKGDSIGAVVFGVLILLGLIAAARAFMVM